MLCILSPFITYRGTAVYGSPNNDDVPWSIKYDLGDFDEFLFASGNMKFWMRATKDEIIGNDGQKLYSNQDIKITSSSKSCSPYTGKTNFFFDTLVLRIVFPKQLRCTKDKHIKKILG